MVNTLPGKIAAIILVVFVIQLIAFIVAVFSSNGFGAMVNFIQFAPSTAVMGLLFGALGVKKEKGAGRMISVITLLIGLIFAGISLIILFGYSFGG
ncbi:hypothetical protein AS034_02500 [[Bacillus] enclensis]|uniref:Uncharacterized protein n=1 Tax=[Bacillus] enclensis TaxID=1402860 RepID=A0A0V8HKE2_9BACI|nr:hypothetical protein [[Bacillus] enclensis]KSU63145.1 hypothetical protein AS034_02500 [[Bacillus] enclensis]QTC42988.1 hypothetical protein I7V34_07025 [Bacillus sp. V3]SCB79097.1 hypothetical protein GA0061094_0517 [[Bacillus] enclensis]